MAFRDFSFPEVQQALGLTLKEADLCSGVAGLELSASFVERMKSDIALALAINTEKARSEFIIAPYCRNCGGCSVVVSDCSLGCNSTLMHRAG